jgi:hypothetical protein
MRARLSPSAGVGVPGRGQAADEVRSAPLQKEGGVNEQHEQGDAGCAAQHDLLVLAAVARAQRHRPAAGTAVTRREIRAHLGLPARSPGAAAARTALERLTAERALRRERRHGLWVWRLTTRGRGLLARAAGIERRLPEAPQHLAWRRAREAAGAAMARLRGEVRRDLREAARLLASGERASADAWFELAERLGRDAWRLGSASYCLHEWAEPDDARADVDTGVDRGDGAAGPDQRRRLRLRRAGRRNTALWEG